MRAVRLRCFPNFPEIHILKRSLLWPAIPPVLPASGRASAYCHGRRPNETAGLYPSGSIQIPSANWITWQTRSQHTLGHKFGLDVPQLLPRGWSYRFMLAPVFHVKQVHGSGGGAASRCSGAVGKEQQVGALLSAYVQIVQDGYLKAHAKPQSGTKRQFTFNRVVSRETMHRPGGHKKVATAQKRWPLRNYWTQAQGQSLLGKDVSKFLFEELLRLCPDDGALHFPALEQVNSRN
ncbi:hypothetical protein QFZ70_003629 [Arthrobacter sp. V1I9]|nr:hypothetical protein [Arthrobacter sp. V1I9]